jgi:hypothetical protein
VHKYYHGYINLLLTTPTMPRLHHLRLQQCLHFNHSVHHDAVFQPHALYVDLVVRRDYSSPAARALRRPRRAPRPLVSGRTRSTSTSLCAATTRLRPHALYVNLAVRCEY